MPATRFPVRPATRDVLVLHTLSLEPARGYAIAQALQPLLTGV
ncbi:MAG TPA: hypothetical protein VHW24_22250 [Bryobacteraceae bacterium]|nr:hypothetical protein [Bryobacteraceae bacterium]